MRILHQKRNSGLYKENGSTINVPNQTSWKQGESNRNKLLVISLSCQLIGDWLSNQRSVSTFDYNSSNNFYCSIVRTMTIGESKSRDESMEGWEEKHRSIEIVIIIIRFYQFRYHHASVYVLNIDGQMDRIWKFERWLHSARVQILILVNAMASNPIWLIHEPLFSAKYPLVERMYCLQYNYPHVRSLVRANY